MCLLIETIKVLDGQFQNLAPHNSRMNNARCSLFGCNDVIDIASAVTIPSNVEKWIAKCTITYNMEIVNTSFAAYKLRNIKSLKAVRCDTIIYSHKYADRGLLNTLFEQRGNCDEILIIKNGLISDTSFSNIIFYDGGKWVTPKNPLLRGTKREKLLREEAITEVDLTLADLKNYSKACLINSMLEPGEITIDCANILT